MFEEALDTSKDKLIAPKTLNYIEAASKGMAKGFGEERKGSGRDGKGEKDGNGTRVS